MSTTLLPRIAAGDQQAVGEFLNRHTALVWGQVRRCIRDAQEAEDAVQDIFLEIWRCADRFDESLGSEGAFVATITRRRLVDRMRRLAARPTRADGDLVEQLAAREQPDQSQLRDEVERARSAMQDLRPEQREVLELALGHGRTHQEIADKVGIPLGTVKSHARRGLMRLRQLLGVDSDAGGAS
ncbi:MAG: sigma-70 family RNA polymerase sigma factor [Planctomycetes bacterium]|nr:sigma-70 family RNA polymerase sigma factor [Planctomycetota bacterium]